MMNVVQTVRSLYGLFTRLVVNALEVPLLGNDGLTDAERAADVREHALTLGTPMDVDRAMVLSDKVTPRKRPRHGVAQPV